MLRRASRMFGKYGTIIIIVIGVIAMLVVLKVVYTKILQRSARFNKGVGMINTFFSKLFGVSSITSIYADFYQSLFFIHKIRLRSARKYIYFDCDVKAENEFGITLSFKKGNLICQINPQQLIESEATEEEVIRLLSKVLKGRLNLTVVNVSLEHKESNNCFEDTKAIGKCFKYIATYLSLDLSYIVNIKDIHRCIGHEQWNAFSHRYNMVGFWKHQKPSAEWVADVVTESLHYQLPFQAQPMSTEALRNLYVFLNSCTKVQQFSDAIIENTPLRTACYEGFGIDLIHDYRITSKVNIDRCYRNYKFGLKVRNSVVGIVMIGMSGALIAGFVNLKRTIPETVTEIVTNKNNNLVNPSEINLENYTLSQKLVHRRDLNLVNQSIYRDKSIHYIGDATWAEIIRKDVILPRLSETGDPIQQYALTMMLMRENTQALESMVSDNLWIWSKVTQIPRSILKVWLKVNYAGKTKGIRFGELNGAVKLKDKTAITKNVNRILNSISYKYLDPQMPLDKALVGDAIELTFLNRMLNSNILSFSEQAKEVADRYHYVVSLEQMVNMNDFMQLLQIRDDLSQISKSKDIHGVISNLYEIHQQVKNFPKKEWDKILVSRLLQRVSSVMAHTKIEKLYVNVPDSTYYSRPFYEKEVAPLYASMLSVFNAYQSSGANVEVLANKMKESFKFYGVNYQAYYKQNLRNSIKLTTNNTSLFISELSSMSSSPTLENTIVAIQSNILSLPKKLDPYMSAIPRLFDGIKAFSESRYKYDALLALYANELKFSVSDPEKVAEYYLIKQNNFNVSMSALLATFKLNDSIKNILLQPALDAEKVGFKPVQTYAQAYWNMTLTPVYWNIFSYFPFNKHSSKNITVVELTDLIGKDGLFWQRYNSVIGKLVVNYPKEKWLSPAQAKMYESIHYLRQNFWDAKGNKKEIVLDIETTGKLPTYTYTKEGWFGAKKAISIGYIGVLSSGKSKVSDIGIADIQSQFKIKWWLPESTSISLINEKGTIVQQRTRSGMWSFWNLLSNADWQDNRLIWDFNRGETQVVFKVNLPDVWGRLGQNSYDTTKVGSHVS